MIHGLKETRKRKKMSQEKLAEALGVERVTVNRWERGLTKPIPVHRERIRMWLKRNEEKK